MASRTPDSVLPSAGMASVRLTLASATWPRYQPQPLVARITSATSAATARVVTTARARPREPSAPAVRPRPAARESGAEPWRDGRPPRGSSRAGSGRPLGAAVFFRSSLTVGILTRCGPVRSRTGSADGRTRFPAGWTGTASMLVPPRGVAGRPTRARPAPAPLARSAGAPVIPGTEGAPRHGRHWTGGRGPVRREGGVARAHLGHRRSRVHRLALRPDHARWWVPRLRGGRGDGLRQAHLRRQPGQPGPGGGLAALPLRAG